jgi:hypothetical protein
MPGAETHGESAPTISIALNDDVALDLTTLIETRLIVQANSGGGKTYAMRRLLEQSAGLVQQIVIDIEGSLRTLRERYEYLLLGSETDEVDFPISPGNAAALAVKLLEMRTSAIVDLNEFSTSMRQRIVRSFLDAMINAPKSLWHDCLLVLDEAHVFSPERDNPESKAAVEALCSRGRIRGFCAILATQRISKLSKDALGECNNKLIGRASLDVDMKRSNAELEFPAKSQALKKLAPGEFYVFGPAISPQVQKIQIGPVTTTHPQPGSRRSISSPPPPKSLDAVLEALRALPASSENRPSERDEPPGDRTRHLRRTPAAQPHVVSTHTEEQAELLRLRRLVEELNAITVTVDGKEVAATDLPMLLRIEELHARAELATITIEGISRLDAGAPGGASAAGEPDARELIRQLQAALGEQREQREQLAEALARKERELQQALGRASKPQAVARQEVIETLTAQERYTWKLLVRRLISLGDTPTAIARELFACDGRGLTNAGLASRLHRATNTINRNIPVALIRDGLIDCRKEGNTFVYTGRLMDYLRSQFPGNEKEMATHVFVLLTAV